MATKIEYIISLTGNFQKKLAKAQGAVGKFNQKLNKLTPSIGGLGKQLIGFASVAAIGAVLIKTGKQVAQYEANIASLSAITGVGGEALEEFKAKIGEVSKDVKGDAVQIAKAFELVGSAKPELLKSAEGLAAVTKSAFILSKASGETLESSVQSLTGTLNQFGLGADKANEVINILAAGSKEGAAAVPLISQALDKFGTVAASMNISVEESVALIEVLAEKNIKGAEAGTALRNVLLKMSTIKALPAEALKQLDRFGVNLDIVTNSALPAKTRLEEMSKIAGDSTALFKVFGLENQVAGQIILQNTQKVGKYTEAITGTNIAQEQANKNTSTLNAKLEELGNAWNNVFTTSSAASIGLNAVKSVLEFVTDNMEIIIGVIGGAIGVFLALKTGILAITSAIKLWTLATAILNGTLILNPIGLVVAAIIALIAIVAVIIIKWDEISAAFIRFITPLADMLGGWDAIRNAMITVSGVFLALFRVIKDIVVSAFEPLINVFKSLIDGLVKIGTAIAEFLFGPFEKGGSLIGDFFDFIIGKVRAFLGFLAKIPIVSKAIEDINKSLDKSRQKEIEENERKRDAAIAGIVLPGEVTGKVPTTPGADTKKAAGAGTSITSQAPKTFIVNIENLVDDGITVNTNTLTEGANKVKEMMVEALIEATNDMQTSVN